MIKYIIQIDMSEFGEPALWQDVAGPMFNTLAEAHSHIEWMLEHYGRQIAYRAKPYAHYPRRTLCNECF